MCPIQTSAEPQALLIQVYYNFSSIFQLITIWHWDVYWMNNRQDAKANNIPFSTLFSCLTKLKSNPILTYTIGSPDVTRVITKYLLIHSKCTILVTFLTLFVPGRLVKCLEPHIAQSYLWVCIIWCGRVLQTQSHKEIWRSVVHLVSTAQLHLIFLNLWCFCPLSIQFQLSQVNNLSAKYPPFKISLISLQINFQWGFHSNISYPVHTIHKCTQGHFFVRVTLSKWSQNNDIQNVYTKSYE